MPAEEDEDFKALQSQLVALKKTVVIPPYGQRKNWVPRGLEVGPWSRIREDGTLAATDRIATARLSAWVRGAARAGLWGRRSVPGNPPAAVPAQHGPPPRQCTLDKPGSLRAPARHMHSRTNPPERGAPGVVGGPSGARGCDADQPRRRGLPGRGRQGAPSPPRPHGAARVPAGPCDSPVIAPRRTIACARVPPPSPLFLSLSPRALGSAHLSGRRRDCSASCTASWRV